MAAAQTGAAEGWGWDSAGNWGRELGLRGFTLPGHPLPPLGCTHTHFSGQGSKVQVQALDNSLIFVFFSPVVFSPKVPIKIKPSVASAVEIRPCS